ncbi:Prolyl oligopeptidase family protein [Amycolatopsis arida]|uniref:Prolyl oligopeptidase family protein n=1 Tax=Amycolatopsis arida TaxID=587909 RepID=A0A1I5Q0M5_9PSEU|nr:prolyl oligopeptidase family serine peptidase [Amycolatopsis arida]TDX98667.1 prolyl oligopeptidase family protein [Amycolatopsis arida]SFP39541.1 Prolyl oligopeptidase family protein [Amycolatopsis arida]
MEIVTGTAAGVPFTALPPAGDTDGPAPLIVTWHMLDAPRTDAAFAAALPMTGVPAWRVHLGMPMCGARMVDGRVDAVIELIREDPLMAYLAPFLSQAADEFPAALAALRDQLPVDDEPVAVLGGSLGGAVALEVLTTGRIPIRAVALVNPAVRIRSAVELIEAGFGQAYPWTAESHTTADELDYVARVAGGVAAQPPLLLVSGERDHPAFRTDAAALVDALRERYARPDDVELTTVPDLAHPLAEEPGLEPAPQLPVTKVVDDILTRWFLRQLTAT